MQQLKLLSAVASSAMIFIITAQAADILRSLMQKLSIRQEFTESMTAVLQCVNGRYV